MSLTVWSFALLHGFFVLIVAGLTHSKTAVAFAAIVAAVAGLLVGDPVYIALDLLCVAVATYYCWADLAKRHQRTPQEIAAAQEKIRLEQRKAEEAAAKRKKTTTTRKAVAPRYRNKSNTAETWTGRGKQPRWLVAELAKGLKLEDFLI